METINSITATAAKVIWGENNNTNETNASTANTADGTTSTATESKPIGTTTDSATMNNETRGVEPISGKQGDVSKGEPYDAGNIEPANQTASTGIEHGATEPITTSTRTADTINNTDTATDTTNTHPDDTTNTRTDTTNKDTETAATAASATEGSKGPTAEHPSTTGDTGFKAAQADVRDPDTNPTANPQKEAERKNVDDTGSLDQSQNPEKVDGAGPKPIEEVARERGGDAGNDGSAAKKDSADPTTTEGDAADNKEHQGSSKGTGEQYVKSSGLQADGGDFDATKPGAGREADRLMEEKGIANPAAAGTKKPEEDTTAHQGHSEGEKKSLKDKIKAKLHKN